MSTFEKFNFKSINELNDKIMQLGVHIELTNDLSVLSKAVKIGEKFSPNALAVLPMEGCDCNPDGSPSELTRRRYLRFAQGGAGLLWYEACAVVHEGRANPLQLYITRNTMGDIAKMLADANEAAARNFGSGNKPVNILQLTHSGRYSRPDKAPAPMIPQHDPLLDIRVGLNASSPTVTDEYLDMLSEKYANAAVMAKECGFDGVDIKSCHRYLLSELLASYTREGKYGGSFENRTRFLLETIGKVRKSCGEDFIIASRFNVYDAHPYPYGFGVDKHDVWKSDLTEPVILTRKLVEAGIDLISNSAGNPYYRFPQVTRPFDMPAEGGEIPDEHPFVSIERLFEFTRRIQKAAGNVPVIGNGYSWLRQFMPYIGAANLKDGSASMIGIGRQAFAYPDAPADIFRKGAMNGKKCCIACSKCTQIMRDHGTTGCVIRDSEVYAPIYNIFREAAKNM